MCTKSIVVRARVADMEETAYQLDSEPRPQCETSRNGVGRANSILLVVVGHVHRLQEHLQRERDVLGKVCRLSELEEI